MDREGAVEALLAVGPKGVADGVPVSSSILRHPAAARRPAKFKGLLSIFQAVRVQVMLLVERFPSNDEYAPSATS